MSSRYKVLTMGSFDILHWAHLDFLEICSKFGKLTVGVNTDKFMEKFKGKPIMGLKERRYALERAGYRTIENSSAGKKLIERLRPDIIVVGSDWARKDYLTQIGVTQDWLDERKIILVYVPYVQKMPMSTTEIKRRVREA